jgi:hypothetical protein
VTNDQIRDLLLRYLYDRHRTARGVSGQEIRISDLKREMKNRHGLSASEVTAHLDYLVQKGWVQKIAKPRTFTTRRGTTQSAEGVTYKVAAEGIDRIEGESDFMRRNPYAGIHIENIGGVTVVGDGNVVRTQFATAGQVLSDLRRAVNTSDLPDERKFEIATQIQTIEVELTKANPERTVIERAWSVIQATATVGTLTDLLTRAGAALAQFLSSPVGR